MTKGCYKILRANSEQRLLTSDANVSLPVASRATLKVLVRMGMDGMEIEKNSQDYKAKL